LPDYPAAHPFADRNGDQEHGGARNQQNRRQAPRGLHFTRLGLHQRPDDVKFGCAGSAIAGLTDKVHFTKFTCRHIEASGMAAKLQHHVARAIELIGDEDANGSGFILECDRTDFDR
jgi:hypothetical protein